MPANVTVVLGVRSWVRTVQKLQTFYGSFRIDLENTQPDTYQAYCMPGAVLGVGVEVDGHLLLHLSVSIATLSHTDLKCLWGIDRLVVERLMQPRGGSENQMRSGDSQCLSREDSGVALILSHAGQPSEVSSSHVITPKSFLWTVWSILLALGDLYDFFFYLCPPHTLHSSPLGLLPVLFSE